MMMPVVSYLLALAAALVCFGPKTNAQQGRYTVELVGIQLCAHVPATIYATRRPTFQLTSIVYFCREYKCCVVFVVVLLARLYVLHFDQRKLEVVIQLCMM